MAAGNDYFIVMEYVRGGDMRAILRRAAGPGDRPVMVGQALAVEQLHHVVESPAPLDPEVVELDGMGRGHGGRDLGLLLNAPRPNFLRFMPALNVTREEIDTMVSLLDQTLTDMAI